MLLATKFFAPPLRADHIQREHALAVLAEQPYSKMVCVVAPAGYGKSQLLSQWLQQTAQDHFAWLTLNEDDNDPRNFWRYVIGALQRLQPQLGGSAEAWLSEEGESGLKGAVSALLNDLAQIPLEANQPLRLVLDDFHLIADDGVLATLDFFLDYLPPTLQLVIGSRQPPPLSLPRRRAQMELMEVGADLLRFDRDETERFLKATHRVELPPEAIDTLQDKTQGWPVGVHLLGLALAQNPGLLDSLAKTESVTQHVADYLINEVFDHLPERQQHFLLHTAHMPRFNPALCNQLLARQDSAQLIKQLDDAHLFLIPMDADQQWYRYHDLFREALRSRLQQTDPDALPPLQIGAAEWFQQQGLYSEALEQIFALGDWNWAVRLIERQGFQRIRQGQYITLKQWLLKLPEPTLEQRPILLLLSLKVWSLATALHINPSERYLRMINERLDEARELLEADNKQAAADQFGIKDPDQLLHLFAERDLLHSYMARLKGDVTTSARLSERVLRQAREQDLPLQSATYMSLGMSHYLRGDLRQGAEAAATAWRYAQEERNFEMVETTAVRLAWVLQWQGEFREAHKVYQESRAFLDHHHRMDIPFVCWQNLMLSAMHREFNDNDRAQECFDIVQQNIHCDTRLRLFAPITLGRLRESQRDFEGALNAIAEAEALYLPIADSVQGFPSLPAAKVKVQLLQGDLASAAQWASAEADHLINNHRYRHEEERITLARVWLYQKRFDEGTLKLLKSILNNAQQGNRISNVVVSQLLLALSHFHRNELDQAAAYLEPCLKQGARSGYVRSIIDEGPNLSGLLQLANQRSIEPDYTQQLLTARHHETAEQNQQPGSIDQTGLIEPLSRRELDVLHLIEKGLANKIIADELFIGIGTVKTHVRNILGKLAVGNRTEAVAKARALGLLG